MDENLEFYTLYHKVIRISWLIILIMCLLLLIISLVFFPENLWYKLSLSFLFGSMTNLFAFNLLKNNVMNSTSNFRKAFASSSSNYIVRFIIYGFVLYVSFQSGKLNPYVVAAGFLTARIALYLSLWLKRKE